MTTYEKCSLVLQFCIALAAFVTFGVYFRQMWIMGRQMRTMDDQLAIARNASEAQNILALVNFLQTQDVRHARGRVRGELSQIDIGQWTEEDRRDASLVVANYDVAAALIKEGLAPVELIASNWGPSIKHCYEVLESHIANVRQKEGGDPTYWTNFRWLYDHVGKSKINLEAPTGGTLNARD